MRKKMYTYILCGIMLSLIFGGCMPDTLWKDNVKIFKNTPAYKLAKAVKDENISAITRICSENPEVLYIQDPYYFFTVLHWAVGMEKYSSVKALLKMGMDPNITTKGWNLTPLFIATTYSFIGTDDTNPKYVKILLEYGADPNIAVTEVILPDVVPSNVRTTPPTKHYVDGQTPLMNTASTADTGLEKARLLVEMGNANVNKVTATGRTAASYALTYDDINLAYYLIVECGADITIPFTFGGHFDDMDRKDGKEPEVFYPVYLLKGTVFPLDSKEYQQKMEIVQAFEQQGVDYWNEPIPNNTLRSIKKRYPDTWQEYAEVY